MTEILRTNDLVGSDSFAHWQQWIAATFMPLECAPAGDRPFQGEVAHWTLGDLHVSRVAAEPHVASRTRGMIALREVDHYKVGLLTRGSCQLAQDEHQALLRPGDLAIYDCRRPYTMSFNEPFEMSFLMFPCHRLRLPASATDRVLATRVPSSGATGSLVAPFLRQLVANLERAEDSVNLRLAENTLDLLTTLFGERTGQGMDPTAQRRSLLSQVHAWIDQHLGEPELNPEMIARGSHISVRYLHKLFHDQDTSVCRWVRARRLEKCRLDLENPAMTDRDVTGIARTWGFDDPAYFTKVFKASYGEPPGRYRHRVLRVTPSGSPSAL